MASALIRILIADDHHIIRWGLRAVLTPDEGMEVVGEAVDGLDVLEKARLLQPDVIIMDLVMPRLDGVDAIRAILGQDPGAHILALTSYEDDARITEAIKAGALGYMLKDFVLDDLLHAVREVARGNLTLSQSVAQKLMRSLQPPTPAALPSGATLTERELDVLRLVGKGLTNDEIAARLTLSKSTVRTHISSLLSKLGLSSRTQAALYARETGLVTRQDAPQPPP